MVFLRNTSKWCSLSKIYLKKNYYAEKLVLFLKQATLQMAEKAFEKLEGMTFGEEPDVGQALLGTDLFIMKGDTKNAEAQLV